MSLVKCSTRTIRSGCNRCGTTDLYWFHDTRPEARQGRKHCGTHDSASWVMVNADAATRRMDAGERVTEDMVTRHASTCSGSSTTSTPATSEESPVTDAEMPADAPVEVPPAVTTDAPAAPAPGSLDAIVTRMVETAIREGSAVDTAQVERIVRERLDEIVFPVRTVVERASGERVEVEGGHVLLPDVVTMLMADLHVMMVGPAGTGKSTLAESSAHALGIPFYSLSLSGQTPNSSILGYMDANGNYVRSLFREAYENGGVFLFDEIDNSNPNALAVVNAALANECMGFPDGMVKRSADFRAVAAANTYGKGADRQYVGRQPMDAATLDRFAVITVQVDDALEARICAATGADAGTVASVLTYCRRLRKSADEQGMRVIVSPRASVGMCKLLHAGMAWEMASEAMILKGMSTGDRAKLGV